MQAARAFSLGLGEFGPRGVSHGVSQTGDIELKPDGEQTGPYQEDSKSS
jgi:hypothetical protein